MHMWGDKDFDWEALDKACNELEDFVRKWGRLGGDIKEKYGTLRFYVNFYGGGLHSLIYPGCCSSQFPKWLWSIDCRYLSKITYLLGINALVVWWQKKVYNLGYQKILKSYPHIAVELVCAADYPELIDGYYKVIKEYKEI